MKKLILGALMFVVFVNKGNAFCRADTVLNYTYGYLSTIKYLTGRTIYTFDTRNNVLTQFTEDYNDATTVWTPNSWILNKYDASDSLIERVTDLWNTSTNTREHSSKVNYAYNPFGKIVDYSSYQWSSTINDWRKNYRTITDYNNANKVISEILQNSTLPGNSWLNSNRKTYFYNGNNQQVEHVLQTWNGTSSTWTNINFTTSLYNSNGLRTIDSIKKWNTTTNVWNKLQITTYVYDAQQKLASKLTREFNTTTSVWEDFQRTIYTVNLYSDILDEENQEYRSLSSVWLNYTKKEYNFDSNGNLLEEKTYKTGGGTTSWSGAEEFWTQYVYNSGNKVVEKFVREGNYPNSPWISSYRNTYEYNNDDLVAADYYAYYEPGVGSFSVHRRSEYQCRQINTGVNDIESYMFSIHPNPVTGGSFTINATEIANYNIIDFTGKSIQSGELNAGDNTISLTSISTGVYFVHVGLQTQKLIVQ